MIKINFTIIVILCFFTVSCAHRYGCVIDVKGIKQIGPSHYLYDANFTGAQYQFDLYIGSRPCEENEKEKLLSDIFQKHAQKNGFKDFEVFNVYQTKVMGFYEYSVAFK